MKDIKNNHMLTIVKMLGIESSNTSFYEKIVSGFGAVLGVYCTYFITTSILGDNQFHLLLASVGASSVLIFVTPHSVLSQPWNIIGGHFFSAILGYIILCTVPDLTVAGSMAVGGAVLVMYLTRCIHPPGGATALFVVLSGSTIPNFNIEIFFETLLVNIVAILIIGLVFNNLFHWRRYPAYLYFRHVNAPKNSSNLSHEDFSAALLHLDSYIDVSTEELALIFDFALENAHHCRGKRKIHLQQNCFYSNAELGKHWSVREVIDVYKKQVNYQTVVGKDISTLSTCSVKEFQKWAKLEVVADNNRWIKKV